MCEQRARLTTSHVLSPVDRFHAPCVFVVVVCPSHQQELNNAHLVVMCGIEKTGPTSLATKNKHVDTKGEWRGVSSFYNNLEPHIRL